MDCQFPSLGHLYQGCWHPGLGHQEGLVLEKHCPQLPSWAPPELLGCLCFLYGVGVSPCGGAATLLQDPDQEGGSAKLLSQGRQRLRAQKEEKPFPSLLATWAPWLPVPGPRFLFLGLMITYDDLQ